ncbi:MAG: AAA family ATPase [Anaerolineae bacterium]
MTSSGTNKTLRILLVTTQDAMHQEAEQALTGGLGYHRLYWVSQPALASSRAQDVLPHVILVDEELLDTDAVSLIRQLASTAPGSAILAMVSPTGLSTASQAMLAGARAFVTKPLHAEDLATSIRQVLARRNPVTVENAEAEQGRSGHVIVFCAPKGGTGRTTLAINLALGIYARNHEKVALVDADYAAPALDVALNLQPERTVAELLPHITRVDRDLLSGILTPHISGVQVLLAPSPSDLDEPIGLPQVQQIVVLLREVFDWVIVDVGLPLDETAFAFLDGADRIIMTVLPEMVGLRNTRRMLDQLYNRGYPPDRVMLVLNRATMQGGVSVAAIEEHLRIPVAFQVPDDQPLATFSINRGVPLIMSHRHSAVAKAVRKLAQTVALEMETDVAADADGDRDQGQVDSPLGRMFGRKKAKLRRGSGAELSDSLA